MRYPFLFSWKRTTQFLLSAGAGIPVFFGAVSLTGWLSGERILSDIESTVPMAPSTAILFIVFGFLMILRGFSSGKPGIARIILISGSIASLLSVAFLILSYLGVFLTIERLGVSPLPDVNGIPVGHMSPLTAGCFILTGMALLLPMTTLIGQRTSLTVSFWTSVALVLISFILLVAYLFGSPLLYNSGFIPPAFTTSVSFLILGIPLLVSNGSIFWTSFSREEDSGVRSLSILSLILLLFTVGLVTTGYFYFLFHMTHHLNGAKDQLTSITNMKIRNLDQWKRERYGNASVFYFNANFSHRVASFLTGKNDPATVFRLTNWLTKLQQAYQYKNVRLLDAGGMELISAVPGESFSPETLPGEVRKTIETGQINYVDLRLEHEKPVMHFMVPVFHEKNNDRVIAILDFCIDPEVHLYPIIRQWPVSSASSESILFRVDGDSSVVLHDLKFKDNMAFTHVFPAEYRILVDCLIESPGEGFFEADDYQGIKSLVYVKQTTEPSWYIVSQVHLQEVYRPMWIQLWELVFLIVVLLLLAILGVLFIWRDQRLRYFRAKALASERLKASEDKFSTAFQTSAILMLIIDSEGIYIDINDYITSFLGVLKEDLVGKHVFSYDFFTDPLSKQRIRERIERDGSLWNYEISLQAKDNSVKIGLLSVKPVTIENKPHWLAGITDITALKKAEESLQRSEERYRTTLDSMLEGCQIIGYDWKYLYLNDAAAMYGRIPKEELLGQRLMDKYPGIEKTELFSTLDTSLTKRIPAFRELEFTFPDGGKRWFAFSIQPVQEGIFVLTLDTTNRKKQEEEMHRLNLILEQKVSERTAELELANHEMEAFVYSVSHDLRAPLRAISGFSYLIQRDQGKNFDEHTVHMMENINLATKRMDRLITDLLKLSRISRKEIKLVKVPMHKLVSSVIKELSAEKGPDECIFRIEEIPDCTGDSGLLHQVWANLIANAIKFSKSRENREISISGFSEGRFIVYRVKDNGVGFNPDYAYKLFQPFQRLHSVDDFEGTGIGLAIVQRIITRHGGTVSAEGNTGEGAVFTFTVPNSSNSS